jgi:hypothetical protein
MGRSDRLIDMNEVYVYTKTTCKEQLTIHLRHMEERFGSLTVWKKGRVCTQHEVPTDHLAGWSEHLSLSTKTVVRRGRKQIYH